MAGRARIEQGASCEIVSRAQRGGIQCTAPSDPLALSSSKDNGPASSTSTWRAPTAPHTAKEMETSGNSPTATMIESSSFVTQPIQQAVRMMHGTAVLAPRLIHPAVRRFSSSLPPQCATRLCPHNSRHAAASALQGPSAAGSSFGYRPTAGDRLPPHRRSPTRRQAAGQARARRCGSGQTRRAGRGAEARAFVCVPKQRRQRRLEQVRAGEPRAMANMQGAFARTKLWIPPQLPRLRSRTIGCASAGLQLQNER